MNVYTQFKWLMLWHRHSSRSTLFLLAYFYFMFEGVFFKCYPFLYACVLRRKRLRCGPKVAVLRRSPCYLRWWEAASLSFAGMNFEGRRRAITASLLLYLKQPTQRTFDYVLVAPRVAEDVDQKAQRQSAFIEQLKKKNISITVSLSATTQHTTHTVRTTACVWNVSHLLLLPEDRAWWQDILWYSCSYWDVWKLPVPAEGLWRL